MNVKKNILVISSSYPKYLGDFNGSFVYELSKNLSQHYNIVALTPWESGLLFNDSFENIKIYRHKQFPSSTINFAYGIGMSERLKSNKLYFLVLPFFIYYQFIALKKIVKKEKIDIIHINWLIPNAITVFIFNLLFSNKIKVMATVWGSDLFAFSGYIGDYIKKILLSKIDFLFTQGEPLKEKAQQIGYRRRIYSLPCGVYTNIFTPENYSESFRKSINPEGPIVLFVGICVESKGVGYLLSAIGLVRKKHPNVKLLLVGDDSHKMHFEKIIMANNINDNIIFFGKAERNLIPEIFASVDVFILPSLSEGWPLSVMESLSSGLPTIVSDLPVFVDNDSYSKMLLISKKGDINSIENKISEVLDNIKYYKGQSNIYRNFAIRNFDWKVISEKYNAAILENL